MKKYIKQSIGLLGLALCLGGAALADVPAIIAGPDIMPYLERMMDWQRKAVSLEVSADLPRALLLHHAVEQHSMLALNGSFELARTIADITPEASEAPTDTASAPATDGKTPPKPHGLATAIGNAEQQTKDLQQQLSHAKSGVLRQRLEAQMRLSVEHTNLLRAISSSMTTSDTQNTGNLRTNIDQLADTIPASDSASQKSGSGSDTTLAQSSKAGGIIGLMSDIYDFAQSRQSIKALSSATTHIIDENHDRTTLIRNDIQAIMRQGGDVGATALPGQKAVTYDDLMADMKQLEKVALAQSHLSIALNATQRDLGQWQDLVTEHLKELGGRFIFRIGFLAVIIGGILALFHLTGRATKRYVLDDRRQQQLKAIRKVAMIASIVIVIFLGFFTDFSSLATFAGLITAGLAVALQNVILSLIAYFHFFSSYGVRLGDRITISGVTGRVTQIGMLRFYLMELEKSDLGYLPTGRLVGFSNSIMFQPLPFFRQTPGTNFVWSEITLTLDPTMEYERVHEKLQGVVQKVYAQQREVIKPQEIAFRNLTQFKADLSDPQMYIKITNSGLIFVIRYAVQRDQESELHLQMTEALVAAIRKDPELKFINVH